MNVDLPAGEGGGGTAMVLCQRQIHRSSDLLERGLNMSCHREGRLAVAFGICASGPQLGKIQMTIMTQAKMVLTNLDSEATHFDSNCVQAMMAHMSDVVSGDEQQVVRTLLELDIKDARQHLIMLSLPPGSSPLEDWVDFRDLGRS